MPVSTMILRSDPGIKRDGTKFDGNFYTDGQWVRFQRGLPRKIGGYRSITQFLPEVSRGFTNFTQQDFVYCHSGSADFLSSFTVDATANCSVISDRTPVAIAATGTITLVSGVVGSGINSVSVNGVAISTSVSFNTSLSVTAADLAANINSFVSSPEYTAVAVGTTVTITSVTKGNSVNGFVVAVVTSGAMTVTTSDMAGGNDALEASDNNVWMFDYQYDSSTVDNYIVAHVSPNANSIQNATGGQIFYGSVTATDPLKLIPLPEGANATGGIVVLHPFLFYYGSDGVIGWSVPGSPTDLSGDGSGIARVWGSKIIKGMPLRAGSGSAPAGLFWAYDAVVRATFTGGDTVFQFDTIATDTSIMNENCVVDYDGVFYWVGVDRFLMFNGVVREVPNTMNLNYFFDGLSKYQRSKVFAFKVTRYGEIWWAYPRGDATECTHAIIYNVRENTWYDTELPVDGRSAGAFNNYFAAPLLTSSEPYRAPLVMTVTTTNGNPVITGLTSTALLYVGMLVIGHNVLLTQIASIDSDTQVTLANGSAVYAGTDDISFLFGYNVWLHEQGVDAIAGQSIRPIMSYFETADLSTIATGGKNQYLRISRIEPDFIQSGEMSVQVTGRANARAPEVYSSKFNFPETATEPYQQIVMLKEQRRELRCKFESNTVGGDYQMGQIIAHIDNGDATVLG